MKVFLALTGASGAPLFDACLGALIRLGHEVSICASDSGLKVYAHEIGAALKPPPGVAVYDNADLFAPPASGSSRLDAMLVVPCSMATLGDIAHGTGHALIARAAQVFLKERKRLALVARETPLGLIQLRNMVHATEAGAVIVPACPGYYDRPQTARQMTDFVAGRALQSIGIETGLNPHWDEMERESI